MDVFAAFTDVLPHDLTTQLPFPAEPAPFDARVNLDVLFRHSGWLHDRKRVFTALLEAFPHSTRTERFRNCGLNAWVIRSEDEPDRYAVVSSHCHDRFCRPCAAFRGRVIANNVAAFLDRREYRFVTFTIKTTDLTLKEGVDKLYRSFAAIRRSKLWTERVRGGCAVCEVKPKAGGAGWHPHLHCIVEGKYLPLKPLRKLWMKITGDSFIVDVVYGRSADDAARYVAKYIAKPFDDGTTRAPHRLLEAIVALHGRRLLTTFGTWRGARLTQWQPHGTWVRVCPLHELTRHAREGDPEARALLKHLIDSMPHCGYPDQRGPPSDRPAEPPPTGHGVPILDGSSGLDSLPADALWTPKETMRSAGGGGSSFTSPGSRRQLLLALVPPAWDSCPPPTPGLPARADGPPPGGCAAGGLVCRPASPSAPDGLPRPATAGRVAPPTPDLSPGTGLRPEKAGARAGLDAKEQGFSPAGGV